MFSSDFSAGDLQPELKSIFFTWKSAMLDGAFPRLTELGLPNAENAPSILSIFEIERTASGILSDFKALYVRSRLSNTLRDKFVGTRLSEHPGFGPGSMIWTGFAEAASSRQPLHASLPYVGPLPAYRSTSEIYLPLLGEGAEVEYLLIAVVLLEQDYQHRRLAGRGPDRR
ncbi:hypothetical protein [Leisingera sp. McT4-56]|uniref:hypothetical protein n=1 Tax=Leisingera sp. McT4-56 TaxID=2881255 RepID=UPI001CF88DE5|nr:hypothetical protein [Leisingera sp. McT4-56]MCB4456530.1 hypothetical protein [Leisingera sp. McT4-56]